MNVTLTYGQRYRARIVLDQILMGVVTTENMLAILGRYQLFGSATRTATGFEVVVKYEGKTGVYELPPQVKSVQPVK